MRTPIEWRFGTSAQNASFLEVIYIKLYMQYDRQPCHFSYSLCLNRHETNEFGNFWEMETVEVWKIKEPTENRQIAYYIAHTIPIMDHV